MASEEISFTVDARMLEWTLGGDGRANDRDSINHDLRDGVRKGLREAESREGTLFARTCGQPQSFSSPLTHSLTTFRHLKLRCESRNRQGQGLWPQGVQHFTQSPAPAASPSGPAGVGEALTKYSPPIPAHPRPKRFQVSKLETVVRSILVLEASHFHFGQAGAWSWSHFSAPQQLLGHSL